MVRAHAEGVWAAAKQHGVPPEAVAGAILWDGIENLYRRRWGHLGPGKVRPVELVGKAEARRVEEEGRVEPAQGIAERWRRVLDPDWAVAYIAAIMSRHADVYARIAGVDIRDDVAVLCTLYQGGHSEARAHRLAARRRSDPSAMPVAGNDMGPWVLENREFIRSLLEPRPEVPDGQRPGAAELEVE